MHFQGHKRRKINNEDSNDNCISNLKTPPLNYGKIGGSSKVIDYSNDFALTNFLERLEDGKYGSVTKEYEALHSQRMQVINFLSALQPSIASRTFQGGGSTSANLSTRQNQMKSGQHGDNLSHDIIDLEVDTMEDAARGPLNTPPVDEDNKEETTVIIVDSDEEDASHQGKTKYDCHPDHEVLEFGASLASQIQKHISRASKLAQEVNLYQLVPYDQGIGRSVCTTNFKPNWQPSVHFEKVVLQTVDEKQRFQDVVVSIRLNLQKVDRLKEARNCCLNFEKKCERQAAEAPNVVKTLYSNAEMNKENECDGNPKFVSSTAIEDISSGMGSLYEVDKVSSQSDGLEDLWKDMSLAMEYSKIDTSDDQALVQQEEECNHSYLLQDDFGLVCRICGVIQKRIDTIFDFQWTKVCAPIIYTLLLSCCLFLIRSFSWVSISLCIILFHHLFFFFLFQTMFLKSEVLFGNRQIVQLFVLLFPSQGSRATRTYLTGPGNSKDLVAHYSGLEVSEDDFIAAELSIHPRHLKQMKPHQLEGFNFLVKNLVTDKPGGCILAHAPGSGKTFMLISFIQSFLAKYPLKKPLVILPKGILPTWKKEFQRWQVEDLPIYDFYSSKADNRSQQLEVLKLWQENKSILFLGYKQFTNIIYDKENSKVSAACREMLLKIPSLLILDEGHTPRNEDTFVLDSLAKVQTPRKVVLSGTLFQNHVREVFNILNLVRPKFLRMETSRVIVKRVLSRIYISGGRKLSKSSVDNAFYDLVEETLQHDENFKRKVTVIRDLRELTKDVLHYYKGDFLEELPGLVDFTVLLNLSAKQRVYVQKLAKFEKFKRTSMGSAVYIHPHLYDTAEKASGDRVAFFNDDKIDSLLESLNIRDGVKTKFFLNILSLAESAGEKLLAFSQYILPLKFLERLIVKTKGWHLGKEIFMISGDSTSEQREWSMEQFNNSPDAKVFFGSIKACGEGISLVGASRVVILDVHFNPSVTRQAIGRAFRPGQLKKVYIYRLVAADSPEEEFHYTSFSKEFISKMWFEWSEYCGHQNFELDEVDLASCEDLFLESPIIGEDIKAVYRR
ncbi:unnamed protein product, partial [Musa banksii]